MDNLQEHIHNNRKELDHIEMPDMDKIWSNIKSGLAEDDSKEPHKVTAHLTNNNESKTKYFSLWITAIAASISLLIGIGIGQLVQVETESPATFDLARYAPSLKVEAQNYQQLVRQKMEEIDIENIDSELFAEVFDELKGLDQEYEKWTKDVPQYIHEQELLKFLQRHYEQKIRVLEILSKEIEKKEHHAKRSIKL